MSRSVRIILRSSALRPSEAAAEPAGAKARAVRLRPDGRGRTRRGPVRRHGSQRPPPPRRSAPARDGVVRHRWRASLGGQLHLQVDCDARRDRCADRFAGVHEGRPRARARLRLGGATQVRERPRVCVYTSQRGDAGDPVPGFVALDLGAMGALTAVAIVPQADSRSRSIVLRVPAGMSPPWTGRLSDSFRIGRSGVIRSAVPPRSRARRRSRLQ